MFCHDGTRAFDFRGPTAYQVARSIDADFIDKKVSAEVLTRSDGAKLVLFSTPRLEGFQRYDPDFKLGSLVPAKGAAAQETAAPSSA